MDIKFVTSISEHTVSKIVLSVLNLDLCHGFGVVRPYA